MALTNVNDAATFLSNLAASKQPAIVGFFGDFSEASRAARPEFEQFCGAHGDQPVFVVDVAAVKGVHPRFGVDSVPAVLLVKGEEVVQRVVGTQTAAYYERAFFPKAPAGAGRAEDRAPSHRVLVYTTSSCSWCVRVKSYLKQQGVSFQEINVGNDPRAAQRMVARSGQQGVPQLDIDGSVVVGFDKARIDGLLGLKGAPASA